VIFVVVRDRAKDKSSTRWTCSTILFQSPPNLFLPVVGGQRILPADYLLTIEAILRQSIQDKRDGV
jgi:hypothetical protein